MTEVLSFLPCEVGSRAHPALRRAQPGVQGAAHLSFSRASPKLSDRKYTGWYVWSW